MPTYIHYSPSLLSQIWSVIVLVLFLLGWLCAAMDLAPLQAIVNDAIRECLVLAKITDKEAAALTGMSETHFRRALSGEEHRYVSLVHLCKLPYRFWLHFSPLLMWMVAKKHAQEIAETFSAKRSA